MPSSKTAVIASLAVVIAAFAAGALLYNRNTAQEQATLAEAHAGQVMRASAARYGAPEARVTIVEFFDPACETCRAYYPLVKQIVNTSFGRVNLMLRWAPLHEGSDQAVLMLEAARLQDKFWPAVEATLAAQDEWASHHAPDVGRLWPVLQAAGIDTARLRADMAGPGPREALAQDVAAVSALKVQRTPGFYVNGKPLTDFGHAQLKALVASELKAAYGG